LAEDFVTATINRSMIGRLPPQHVAFLVSFVSGVLLLVGSYGFATATLGGFVAAATLFIAFTTVLMRQDSAERLQIHAVRYDASRPLLLFIAALVFSVVILALVIELARNTPHSDSQILLAITALLLAWIFGNLTLPTHYAHLYYQSAGEKRRGGLDFPGADDPDFCDFCYFSFVVGMTFQVSDVVVNDQGLRRLVMLHGLIAFVFNIGAVALTVNVVGSIN
jgi:uncharacterized membrane protein